MQKTFLAVATSFFLATSAFASDWAQLGASEKLILQVDKSSIKRTGNKVRMWVKYVSQHPVAMGQGQPFKYFSVAKYLQITDCSNNKTALIQSIMMSAAEDEVISSSISDEKRVEFHDPAPDTFDELTVNFACSNKESQAKMLSLTKINDTSSMSDSLTTSLHTNLPPPVPVFADMEKRLEYLRWKNLYSESLTQQFSDKTVRHEFLATLWYEAKRSNTHPNFLLGIIEVVSKFQSLHVGENGARGFMGVNPKWTTKIGDGDLKKLFQGQVNLRYGCVVFRHYLDQHDGDYQKGLLNYAADSLGIKPTDRRSEILATAILAKVAVWSRLSPSKEPEPDGKQNRKNQLAT